MADKKMVNLESVSNPDLLVGLLRAMDEEIDEIRTLVNEIHTDQALLCSCLDSNTTNVSTLGGECESAFSNIASVVTAGSNMSDCDAAPSCVWTSGQTAGPAVLTAASVVEKVEHGA